jgi:hypothetical protein
MPELKSLNIGHVLNSFQPTASRSRSSYFHNTTVYTYVAKLGHQDTKQRNPRVLSFKVKGVLQGFDANCPPSLNVSTHIGMVLSVILCLMFDVRRFVRL